MWDHHLNQVKIMLEYDRNLKTEVAEVAEVTLLKRNRKF
jgi:hypothetical protein